MRYFHFSGAILFSASKAIQKIPECHIIMRYFVCLLFYGKILNFVGGWVDDMKNKNKK